MSGLPVKQPSTKDLPSAIRKPIRFGAGAKRSVAKLRELGFDPISALVATYHQVLVEIDYQEKLKAGKLVELNVTGTKRAYNSERHYMLFDKLINISKELLRYGYGRVPEVSEFRMDKPETLVINLTKEGDTYQIGELPQGEVDDDSFED